MSTEALPSAPATTEFKFPLTQHDVGMPVAVSFDKNFTRPMLGLVNKVKTVSIEVLLFPERRGVMVYPNIRHKDDPFFIEHPEAYSNGVFEFSGMMQRWIRAEKQIAKLEENVTQLTDTQNIIAEQLDEVNSRVPTINMEENPIHNIDEDEISDASRILGDARRRGRPPKVAHESVET